MAARRLAFRNDLTQEYVQSRLHYDRTTGLFTWLPRAEHNGSDRRWNRQYAGSAAGTPNSSGYIFISIDGRRYAAHRLAWLVETGEWPNGDLDHRDRDRSHNWISNLRPATEAQNQANTGLSPRNTSGFKGAWSTANSTWQASIRINGMRKHLGTFKTKEDAAEAYRQAAIECFGEFAPSELG